jgi:hypothetical protein
VLGRWRTLPHLAPFLAWQLLARDPGLLENLLEAGVSCEPIVFRRNKVESRPLAML